MIRTRQLLVLLCVSLLFGAGLFITPDAQAQDEPITFGFYAPLTGPAAADGESAQHGAKLAVKHINEEGGVLGQKLELEVMDDGFSPDGAANATRRLIQQEGVDAVISGSYSFLTRAGAPIAQRNQVPFMAAYAVHPSITKTGKYVWRIGALAEVQGKGGAQMVMEEFDPDDIGLLVIDNDYGVALAETFRSEIKKRDANIVFDARYPLGESNFRPLVAGIAKAEPDVLYVTGYYGEASSIVRQIEEAGLDIQIVGVEGFDSPTFLELAGKAANGVVFTTDLNRDSDREMVQQFLKDHREMYDIEGDMVGAHSYDAVRVLARAIENVNSTESQAILDGLRGIEDYEALTGTIQRFTDGREVVRPVGAQIVKDMEFHFFWETEDPEIITPPR